MPYTLSPEEYTLKNALLWGNFIGHCKKANEGKWGERCVHVFIATAEFLPIISQIVSIFETIICKRFFHSSKGNKDLADKTIKPAPPLQPTDQERKASAAVQPASSALSISNKASPDPYLEIQIWAYHDAIRKYVPKFTYDECAIMHQYISRNQKIWDEQLEKEKDHVLIPCSAECPRSILYTKDKKIFILFNKHTDGYVFGAKKEQEDERADDKVIKRAFLWNELTWFASASLVNNEEEGWNAIEATKRADGLVKGIVGVLQNVCYKEYVKKGVKKLRVIMPLASYDLHTRLFEYEKLKLPPLTTEQKVWIAFQILRALINLHTAKVMHRDLKLENIFLFEDGNSTALIADTESCIREGEEKQRECIFTTTYLAPESLKELLKTDTLRKTANKPLDVWQVACIIFTLFYTKLPSWMNHRNFDSIRVDMKKNFQKGAWNKIKGAVFKKEWWPKPDEKTLALLVWKMLNYDPKKRITAEQIEKEMATVPDFKPFLKDSQKA